MLVVVTASKDGSWRHTIRGLQNTDADPGRSRVSKGHRTAEKRCWEEAIHRLVMVKTLDEVLRQTLGAAASFGYLQTFCLWTAFCGKARSRVQSVRTREVGGLKIGLASELIIYSRGFQQSAQ